MPNDRPARPAIEEIRRWAYGDQITIRDLCDYALWLERDRQRVIEELKAERDEFMRNNKDTLGLVRAENIFDLALSKLEGK